MIQEKIHATIGIGFGPGNLALAIMLEEMGQAGNVLFVERATKTEWHPNTLLQGADIQNNPIRDLVTPRNPRSRFSFINYLHEEGRLFEYLNLGVRYPLRKDFAKYVTWAADQFSNLVLYNTSVTGIGITDSPDGNGKVYSVELNGEEKVLCRGLVIGTGRTANIPDQFKELVGARVFHLNHYLERLNAISKKADPKKIVVIGGSQTAIELVLDITTRYPDTEVLMIMRSFSVRLKDTSPFSERVYYPEFVDYFFNSSLVSRKDLTCQLAPTNYSSADKDVIDALYLRLYEQRLDGRERIKIINNTEILAARANRDGVSMDVREIHRDVTTTLDVDCVVLATGFRNLGTGAGQERVPLLLAPIFDQFKKDEEGVLFVNRDYSLSPADNSSEIPPVYLNGLCESSHGLGDAGSFSLLSIRAQELANSLVKNLLRVTPSTSSIFQGDKSSVVVRSLFPNVSGDTLDH